MLNPLSPFKRTGLLQLRHVPHLLAKLLHRMINRSPSQRCVWLRTRERKPLDLTVVVHNPDSRMQCSLVSPHRLSIKYSSFTHV
jgi:hypothetical protein